MAKSLEIREKTDLIFNTDINIKKKQASQHVKADKQIPILEAHSQTHKLCTCGGRATCREGEVSHESWPLSLG